MGRNWAASIGINGYQFTTLASLKYAKSDAITIADFFKKDACFHRVWLFVEDSESIFGEPTIPYRTPLLRFFNKQFDSPFLTIEDSFWLFFSGHGIRRNGKDYILPIDGDPDYPEDTALSLDFIAQRLSQSGAGHTYIMLDSCRTEGGKGKGFGDNSYDGVTTIYSCQPHESSWEIGDPISHGAFTYVLAETLRNQFRGKYLSLEQTEKELQEEISILNNRFGKPRQTPHIRCESAQRVSLNFLPSSLIAKKIGLEKTNSRRKSRTERRSKKDLISLKSEALKAETAGQFELAKDLWHQLLLASPSQQDSYFKAIKRIAEAEVNLNHYTFYKKVIKNEEDKASQSTVNNNKSLSFELNVNNVTLKQSNLFRFESIYLDYDGKNIDRSTGEAQLFAEILDATSIEMILIPGGSFLMGSSHAKANPNELPAHIVTLDYSFMMSKYPITKGQWREVAKLQKINQDLPMRTCLQGGINHPVVNVSWNEAVEFCGRLAHKTGNIYRLPTEAEWEYACRAKTTTLFHFGHSINSNLANFEAQNLEPVGKFPFANQYGLFDMHGNIWEWCQDNWHENYYGAPTDGSPWLDSELSHNRLLRGGSWQNESGLCRSASRMFDHANSKSNNIGFRIASLI